MKQKLIPLIVSIALPALLVPLRPLGLSAVQAVILAAILCAIIWWVTGLVERTLASVLLLAVLFLSGQVPVQTVFSFPLSENFWLILFSFLFSQGIANSGLPDKLVLPLLERWANSGRKLLLSMLLLPLVMILIIPQPFSRVIILSLLYERYFDRLELEDTIRRPLMFGVYAFSIGVNMMFLRGDIILNGALLSISGVSLSEGDWIGHMAVPGLVLMVLLAALFALVFRAPLGRFPRGAVSAPRSPLTARERGQLVFLVVVLIFWAVEDLHGVSGTYIVVAATLLMFPLGMLRFRSDLKAVNVKLMVFLTAAFSIGGSLKACGAAERLFSPFAALLPQRFSLGYAAVVVLAAMVLHMLLGSNVTTLSVVVPALMSISVIPQVDVLLFLIYISACGHYLLPFHSVLLLLGEGKGYFTNKEILRFGLPATVLLIGAVFLLYLPWWRLMGFI